MGLASFNRMRRQRNEVEKIEAERFKLSNEARQAGRQAQDMAHRENRDRVEEVREAETAAVEAIGEKNREGMETAIIDLPLREDHAAEIAGRNMPDMQSSDPIDPVELRNIRVPEDTANEKLASQMQVDTDGPSKELVNAAAKEVGSLPDAAPKGEGVAPQGETIQGESAEKVSVPADWEDLHWTQQVKLAEQISGSEVKETNGMTKVDVARDIIGKHVAPVEEKSGE